MDLVVTGLPSSFIGLLPEGVRPYHFVSAAIFFLSLPIVSLVAFATEYRIDHPCPTASLALGILALSGVALFFLVKMGVVGGVGLAVPEIVAVVPSSLWAGITFYRKLYMG